MSKTVLTKTIPFSISTQLKCQTVLFDSWIGPFQVLLLQAKMDLGTMAMKGYAAFSKAPALLSVVSGHSLGEGPPHLQRNGRCILQPQQSGQKLCERSQYQCSASVASKLSRLYEAWFSLIWFYGISTIVGYLMPNLLCTYILNIYDLVWLWFMAYQPL